MYPLRTASPNGQDVSVDPNIVGTSTVPLLNIAKTRDGEGCTKVTACGDPVMRKGDPIHCSAGNASATKPVATSRTQGPSRIQSTQVTKVKFGGKLGAVHLDASHHSMAGAGMANSVGAHVKPCQDKVMLSP